MSSLAKHYIYRIFCILSLLVLLYLVIDFKIHKRLDIKIIIMMLLFLVIIFWGLWEWIQNEQIRQAQEKELKTYQLYIQPLEELTKEIRARQHEFDNHMNALLNMHLTIDNYDELVRVQSEYMKELRLDESRRYISLLKISDKILAGFLYSKIVKIPQNVKLELNIQNFEILSTVPEHDLIEVVGTLFDNAVEACGQDGGKILLTVDSREDHLLFEIKNEAEQIGLEEVSRFFEKGYSTKGKNRGLGLYHAKQIIERYKGEIFVAMEAIEERPYISFKVEI